MRLSAIRSVNCVISIPTRCSSRLYSRVTARAARLRLAAVQGKIGGVTVPEAVFESLILYAYTSYIENCQTEGQPTANEAWTHLPALHARRRGRRRQAVTAHDLCHLYAVGWTAGRRLTEKLRTDRSRCDQAQRFRVLSAVVLKAVDGPTRNAKRLPWPDVNLLSLHSPCQHSFEAVNGLFVMVMAMGRTRQALRSWDHNLKRSDAASRLFSGDQEANRQRSEPDGLIGRIDIDI